MRALALTTILLLTACTGPMTDQAASHVTAANSDCFNVSFLTGYESVDRDTIRVRISAQTQYDIELGGAQCNELDWTHRLAIESTPGSYICAGSAPGQGYIYFRDPATRRRVQCYIQNVTRVPPPPDAHGS